MPRMMVDDTMETQSTGGMQAFQFSGKRIEHLANIASEFTLATIAIDVTGSVSPFSNELRNALVTSIEACKKSPRKNNLLVRVVTFSTSMGQKGIEEIHGFKPLSEINTADYPNFQTYGSTNLYDAIYSTAGATNTYSKTLMDQDFIVNGILIVITDGEDNASKSTMSMVKSEIEKGSQAEVIESLVTILVGVNAINCKPTLEKLASKVGMKYIDVADATPGKLAKLAEFVSQSISSQSQSLGTGGPSQQIALTI